MEPTNEVVVTQVGWGKLVGREGEKSSCMSNEQGPIGQRFQNCHLGELVGSFFSIKFPLIFFENDLM